MNARPTWTLLVVAAIAVAAITVGWGAVIQPGLRGYGPLALGLEPTQTPHPTLTSGSTRASERDGMTMVFVPAGDFEMGWRAGPRNERPQHTVYVDAFWIDQIEVTNGQYAHCVRDRGCTAPARSGSETRLAYYGHPAYADYPVTYVDWQQAKAYCEWAGRRLPTEAEWEKAARGVEGRAYPWGDRAPHPDLLNCDGQVGDTTAAGRYPSGASPYGALDMLGNVTEWVSDCFDCNAYRRSARQNPAGPVTCRHGHRAIRGSCSWASPAHDRIGAADRLNDLASTVYPDRGFRCALSPRDAPSEGRESAPLRRTEASLLGEYLGQSGPGSTPAPFVPQVFSVAGDFGHNLHSSVYFSADGGRVYFANQAEESHGIAILVIAQDENGIWSEPVHLDRRFGLDLGLDTSLSPDGEVLFLLDRGTGVYWMEAGALESLS